jgi:hypothetical protein
VECQQGNEPPKQDALTPLADFLLIITSRIPSCRLLSQPIYLATDFRLLPLSPLSTSTAILNHPVEKELLDIVEQGLKSSQLWFSYGLDLTNSLQRQKQQEESGNGVGKQPMWKRADDRFFWNKSLMGRMIESTQQGVDVSIPIPTFSVNEYSLTVSVEPVYPAGHVWM